MRHASDTKVVISLTDAEIRELRQKYKIWKTKPEIRSSVSIEDGKVTVSLREIAGVPVTLASYRLKIQTTKFSLLCSSWRWDSAKEIFGILAEPKALMNNRPYQFSVELKEKFSFVCIGMKKNIKIKVVLEGVDSLGRKVIVEI